MSHSEEAAAVVTSLAIGAGVAVASWYVLRLFLSRESLARSLSSSRAEGASRLPAGDSSSEPGG